MAAIHTPTQRLRTRHGIARTAFALGLLLTLPAPLARADLYEEVHVFHKEVVSPTWGTVYEESLDVPRFDTLGGSRQLLGYRAEYALYLDYTVIVHDNLLPYSTGSEGTWAQSWRGSDGDGYVLFPATRNPPEIACGRAIGIVVDPLAAGWTGDVSGEGLEYEETIAEPARLDILTGSGILEVDSELTLSAIDYHAVPPEEEPIPWNPDLLEIVPQRLYLDMTLTYVYVPEPGMSSLMVLGGLFVLRRR
jgi:hypothetical protein